MAIIDKSNGVVPEVLKTYPGGKNGAGVVQKLINQIPPHRVYVEPFLGSGAIMRNIKPAKLSYGVELDELTYQKWRGSTEKPGINIIKGDGISWLKKYEWQGDEFVYCDPPYMMETRTGGKIYNHEMTNKQHEDLLTTLLTMSAGGVKIMVSGYWSKLYKEKLNGWRLMQFEAMTRGGLKTESVWMNYKEPDQLHDYSFLGDGFRERERIKRKIQRHVSRLNSLPLLERLAIIEAINKGVR